MAVTVDIPGVGSVQATNAAENSTLQAILTAIQSQQGVTISAAGAKQLNIESSKAAKATSQAAGQVGFLGVQSKNTGNQLSDMGRKASMQFKMAAGTLARSFTGSGGVSSIITGLGEAAGGLLKTLPLLGGASALLVGALTGQVAATIKSYETSLQAGGSFGFSLDKFRDIANSSGLTLGQFSQVAIKAGDSLTRFGGNTAAGGEILARNLKSLSVAAGGRFRTSLLRMGMDFQEQGVAMADYIGQLAVAGENIGNLDTSEVTRGFYELTKQQKIQAQFNGITLEQQRAQMKAQQKDVDLQAVMFGLNGKQKTAMMATVDAFEKLGGPGFGQLAKEILGFEGAISGNTAMLTTQQPELAAKLKETIAGIKAGSIDASEIANVMQGIDIEAFTRNQKAQAESAKLGLAGVSNVAITAARDAFIPSQEAIAKFTNGVLDKIVADIDNIDVSRVVKTMGNLDTAMVAVADGGQSIKTSIEKIATDLFETDISKRIVTGAAGFADNLKEFNQFLTNNKSNIGSAISLAIEDGMTKVLNKVLPNSLQVAENFYGGAIGLGQTSVVGESRPGGRGELITAGTDMNVVNNENSQSIVGTLKGVADKMASMSTAQRMDPDAMNAMKQLPGLVMQLTDVVRSTSRDNSDALNNLSYNI